MDKHKTHSTVRLRTVADEQRMETDNPASPREEATGEVLHELRVHQRKLEGQNEKLRMALVALDALRARYSNFFEMAPLGCVALNEEGMIQEANLLASTMLRIPRVTLNDKPLSEFIAEEDHDDYHLFRSALFDTGAPQACELRMKQHDGAQLWVRLEATVVKNQNTGGRICLATISDITKPRNLKAELVRTDLVARMDGLAGDVEYPSYFCSSQPGAPPRRSSQSYRHRGKTSSRVARARWRREYWR
jgi:PAS domain S-box-containing protein